MPQPLHAQCACGTHRIDLPSPAPRVTVCFCRACQRRTGGPFGLSTYYEEAGLQLPDLPARRRHSDAGRWLDEHRCTDCGSVLFYRFAWKLGIIGIPLGLIDGARHLPPDRAVFCENKPAWVTLPAGVTAYLRGSDGPLWSDPTAS